MNQSMPKLLQGFINGELHDAELYRVLARSAPNEQARRTLDSIARDEQNHAENFSKIYKSMTGYKFEPNPPPVKDNGSFRSIVKERIIDEINDAKKFCREYMNTSDNLRLKRAFFEAYNDEMTHASQLVYLLI